MRFIPILSLAGLSLVLAHGEPTDPVAIARRDALLGRAAASLTSSCAGKLDKRDTDAIERRQARTNDFVNKYLAARGKETKFNSRSLHDGVHRRQSTCVLAPEQEEGPYYVEGELVRYNITESEPGIDLLLDVTLMDSSTCEPIADVMVDFWHCNATGLYSDEQSEGTLGETYFRGLQASDDDGVVQIATKVPGWYGGRAQHIHLKAHVDYTVNDDSTISGGTVPHTGQFFFDQDLLSQINVLWPYTLDTNVFTENSADSVIQNQASTTDGYDPYLTITYLGDSLEDGLLGEITIVIDPDSEPAVIGGGSGGGMGGGGMGGGPGRFML